MNNFDVARNFINGKSAKGSHFTTDGRVLYSYNTAIAKRMSNGEIIINNTNYSRSTNKHLNFLKRNIPSDTIVSYTGGKQYNYNFEDFDKDEIFRKQLRRTK